MTIPNEGVFVQELKKYFLDPKRGLVKAVDGISFEAHPGEILAVLGPNGAGKTTCLRVIATVMSPTGGNAYVNGFSIKKDPEKIRTLIGFHPGDAGTYHRLTPFEMVTIFAGICGIPFKEAKRRAIEIFERFGLTSVMKVTLGKLSTGQRQKSAIARIMVIDPPVWILDEPALGLDVPTTREVENAIIEAKNRGKTIILSTHSMEQAEYLADRIVVIDNGRVKATGTMENLRQLTGKVRLREVFMTLINAN